MQKSTLLVTLLLAVLCCAESIGCKESHEVLVIMATGLESANRSWEARGKPQNFNPMSTVRSTSETYYVFTNEVKTSDATYHCRFAARSHRVPIPGALVITEENVLLWIRDSDGKVVTSPLKNGIE